MIKEGLERGLATLKDIPRKICQAHTLPLPTHASELVLPYEEQRAAAHQRTAGVPGVSGHSLAGAGGCPARRSGAEPGRLGGSAGPAPHAKLYGSPDPAGFSSCRSGSFPVAGICSRLALCYPLLFPPQVLRRYESIGLSVFRWKAALGEARCLILFVPRSFPVAEVQRGWLAAWHPFQGCHV